MRSCSCFRGVSCRENGDLVRGWGESRVARGMTRARCCGRWMPSEIGDAGGTRTGSSMDDEQCMAISWKELRYGRMALGGGETRLELIIYGRKRDLVAGKQGRGVWAGRRERERESCGGGVRRREKRVLPGRQRQGTAEGGAEGEQAGIGGCTARALCQFGRVRGVVCAVVVWAAAARSRSLEVGGRGGGWRCGAARFSPR